MSKKHENSGQLSFDLQGCMHDRTVRSNGDIKEVRKGHHLFIVASNCSHTTKMQQAPLNPYSAEITHIIRAKGKALGW